MPTILRVRGYRFFFFGNEGGEAPHRHIESGENYAKSWFEPVELARSVGYNPSELAKVRRLVEAHQALFPERWHGYFGQA